MQLLPLVIICQIRATEQLIPHCVLFREHEKLLLLGAELYRSPSSIFLKLFPFISFMLLFSIPYQLATFELLSKEFEFTINTHSTHTM